MGGKRQYFCIHAVSSVIYVCFNLHKGHSICHLYQNNNITSPTPTLSLYHSAIRSLHPHLMTLRYSIYSIHITLSTLKYTTTGLHPPHLHHWHNAPPPPPLPTLSPSPAPPPTPHPLINRLVGGGTVIVRGEGSEINREECTELGWGGEGVKDKWIIGKRGRWMKG